MDKVASDRRPLVLVVEDEWLIAAGVVDDLLAAGYEVAGPASCVRQAEALINSEITDLALLDIHLNGDTSFGIADVLAGRGIPYIFSSGFSRRQIPPAHQHRPLLPKPLATCLMLEALVAATADRVQGR